MKKFFDCDHRCWIKLQKKLETNIAGKSLSKNWGTKICYNEVEARFFLTHHQERGRGIRPTLSDSGISPRLPPLCPRTWGESGEALRATKPNPPAKLPLSRRGGSWADDKAFLYSWFYFQWVSNRMNGWYWKEKRQKNWSRWMVGEEKALKQEARVRGNKPWNIPKRK